ncbi:MAG: membrane-associated phospholipid phosphatase [Saprospiraceae bacterium]|jgi:membrane-associated phospholipid phosphatase
MKIMIIFSKITMKISILGLIIFFLGIQPAFGQSSIYKIDLKKDGIILGTGIGASLLGHVLLTNADPATQQGVEGLNIDDLNFLDRSSALNISSSAVTVSDIILFSSVVFPFSTYLTKGCRNDKIAIGIMALETFLITNGITNIIKAQAGRYRPNTYNPDIGLDEKLGSSSRLSFLSGHASFSAAMSFFTAKVIIDTNPDIKNKLLVWVPAALIPATISYLRVKGGRHFPTDVIGGYVLGATIGYLIPSLHKREDVNMEFSFNRVGLRYEF